MMRKLVVFLFVVFGVNCLSATDILLKPGNLATVLEQARKASKPVRIIVEDGMHPITETIRLSEVDSGVTWSGKNAVFMAGRRITGWQKADSGLWKATLPDKTWKFEQLWINGRRATLARSPNKGYYHITEAVGAGVFPDLNDSMNFHAFSIPGAQFEVLKKIPQAQRDDVLLTVTHAWAVGQCRIKALNDEALSVQIKGRSRYPFVEVEPDQRFWMENYRAALDAPGEWFLDKAKGELLYLPLPGEDMTKVEVIAPMLTKFIVIKGARNIRFEGISFQYSQYLYPTDGLHDVQAATSIDGCIEVEDSSGIQFENCEIAHAGTHAVRFKNGCSDSSIKHCHLHDLGGGGVYVGDTTRPTDDRVNHHIIVDDCIIQHGGRLHPSACGVVFTHTQHCEVKHCDIGDFYYTGVSAGWNWGYGDTASRQTLIENNHIHHLGWGYLSDMGGYYGLGTSPGTIVRGNHVHHIVSHRYGGWGLYNDEGSTDTLMENNLVHDTWNAGFHQHYGYFNVVRNNIFAFGGSAQIQASRNEPRLRFKFERNIVAWDPEVPLLDGGQLNWNLNDSPRTGEPKDTAIFRNNLYWPTNGKIPALLSASHYTWDEWLKMGRDSGSIFANPMFEDIRQRNFRIKPGSPAEKIGFKPWDIAVAGVRKTNASWVALAAKGSIYPNWATDARPWPAPSYAGPASPYEDDQDFEKVPIGVLGIRNAKVERARERKNLGEGFGVSEEAASPIPVDGRLASKRSLKAQDMPGLAQTFDPVLDIYPSWKTGTFRVSFDIMAKQGADWFFEMRGKGRPFADGPYVHCVNGKLVANNGNSIFLADINPEEWCRISITAKTGSGVYNVTLTRQDGSKKEFQNLPMKPTWRAADYLLFASLANRETAYFIDNLKLESLAK